MNLAQVLILGLVQGATEFLPISSTAHLILLPWFFKFPDPGLVFDISLHLGTLLAILIYFRREWGEIARVGAEVGTKIFSGTKDSFLKNFVPPRALRQDPSPESLLKFLIIATIPAIFFGVLFESWAESLFRTPVLIATTLVVFGVILWLVDTKASKSKAFFISKKEALLIGLWQALAIIPGVSRSGASITGGLLVGLKREAAVKFSFLLSAPIIAGSTLVGLWQMFHSELITHNSELLLGILTSFISGILAIKFLLAFIQKRSFLPFVIYRILLAVLILITLV